MKKLLNTVYVNNPDRYLSLDGENLVLSQEGNEIGRVPLHNIERIMTFGHAGASPALMGKCAKEGIELVFMSRNGHFLARVEGEVKGNVLLRRQQYRYADDKECSLGIAKNITKRKMSPASIGGGLRFRFSVGVQSPTETLNDGLSALIK